MTVTWRSRIVFGTAMSFCALAACSSGNPASTTENSTPNTSGTSSSTLAASTSDVVLSTTSVPGSSVATLPAVAALLDGAAFIRNYSLGEDRLGVWVCHVPVGTTDPIYNPVDFRLEITDDRIAALLNQHVTPYFTGISDGAYSPEFVASGEIDMAVTDTHRDCVDKAQRASSDDITGLVVVADAEHGENQNGGWGRPGKVCGDTSPCRARDTGRAVYIGASDFHPEWGEVPAVDLMEHEIGHALGFPHSGDGNGYTSNVDLMSNSAAPREYDPDRRNAPDTLAVNRLAAGWMPLADVAVAATDTTATGTVRLAPSNTSSGTRLLVLPLDDLRFISVEVLGNVGNHSYLPSSGVIVHEIDQRPTACRSGADTTPCRNEYRTQVPLSGTRPFTDLLGDGSTWSGEGWAVEIQRESDSIWVIDYRRTN